MFHAGRAKTWLPCCLGALQSLAVLAQGLPENPRDWACAESLVPVPQIAIDQWCREHPDRGLPLPEELRSPPALNDLAAKNDYDLRFGAFLKSLRYKQELGWLRDTEWRFTGPIVGPIASPESYATHLPVRIYYSPEVIDWLCEGRTGDLPEGAAIIKEMHTIPSLDVAIGDDGCMDILSTLPGNDIEPLAWLPMVRRSGNSRDGWYWAGHQVEIQVNLPGAQVDPPILGLSGISRPDFYQQGNPPLRPDPDWYPSGYWPDNKRKYPNVLTPLNSYGSFCLACHASAGSEFTFASIENVMGFPIRYKQFDADSGAAHATERFVHTPPGFVDYYLQSLLGEIPIPPPDDRRNSPFASPLPEPDPDFLRFYDQLGPVPFPDVWAQRLPAQTYDHVVPGPQGAATYLTSDQCAGCHDALNYLDSQSNMKLELDVDGQHQSLNLSEWAEWSTSPMGLAGRDPIFFSQLESETSTLPHHRECIENTCLHCHAVMGQRQLASDTPGQSNPACDAFFGEPPPPEVPQGRSFRLDMVRAWPGGDGAVDPMYGALARDGVSCTSCHRIAPTGLGDDSTYTGNFVTDPPHGVNGPFRQVSTRPMENVLGITPGYGEQIGRSELCGSCHAILLPVFDNNGTLQRYSYEQTTYLEWENSDYHLVEPQTSCQDCHMPTQYQDRDLRFRIANIESPDFPPTRNRLPDADILLTPREPYARHSLHGVNVFLNQMFQQFPLLLGYRQGTFFNVGSAGRPPLLLGQDSMLDMAANHSARVDITRLQRTGDGRLTVDVQVTNLAGHFLPSGVGFRRMFLEFLVEDDRGEILWASGRTNRLGAILDGTSERVLPSEQPVKYPDAPFQPHYQTIRAQDEVQIYQELVKDSEGRLTSSFLRRFEKVKDNRIRPKGFLPARFNRSKSAEIRELARTPGAAGRDPDYLNPNRTGADSITYEVQLGRQAVDRVARVAVKLHYQSIPPAYLQQRFRDGQDAGSSPEIERLYYMTSHLNTTGDEHSPDTAALRGWKLTLASAEQAVPPPERYAAHPTPQEIAHD